MKHKRPCIRNLDCFKKTGCPEKAWDGQEGCPAWKEYIVPQEGDKPPTIIKDCIDILKEHWAFEALKLLEGNQQATESFRNGMCETGPDGRVYPKPDAGICSLLSIIENATLKSSSTRLLNNNQDRLNFERSRE